MIPSVQIRATTKVEYKSTLFGFFFLVFFNDMILSEQVNSYAS